MTSQSPLPHSPNNSSPPSPPNEEKSNASSNGANNNNHENNHQTKVPKPKIPHASSYNPTPEFIIMPLVQATPEGNPINIDLIKSLCSKGLDSCPPEDRAISWLILSRVFTLQPEDWPSIRLKTTAQYMDYVELLKLKGYEERVFENNTDDIVFNLDDDNLMNLIHIDILRTSHHIQFLPFPDNSVLKSIRARTQKRAQTNANNQSSSNNKDEAKNKESESNDGSNNHNSIADNDKNSDENNSNNENESINGSETNNNNDNVNNNNGNIGNDNIESDPNDDVLRPFHQQMRRIERILYIFASLNRTLSYLQGFNELATVLYYCFSMSLPYFSSDLDEMESFTFSCFQSLLSSTKLNELYTTQDKSSLIHGRMGEFMKILGKHLPNAANIVNAHQIHPLCFCFKWLNLLFAQEYLMPNLMLIWDALFSHFDELIDYANYIAVAHIKMIEKEIDINDYVKTLTSLQKKEVEDVRGLLLYAKKFWEEDHIEGGGERFSLFGKLKKIIGDKIPVFDK